MNTTTILTRYARDVLRPLGLRQKGRSRTWLDDHGWWLGVVEFQPSSWSKGSYLNVGATLLWRPEPEAVISFDFGPYRVEPFVEAQSEEQFAADASRLAERAAEEIIRLRATLPNVAEAASALERQARRLGGWDNWHAAVALGLSGQLAEAASYLDQVIRSEDDREWWIPVRRAAHRLRKAIEEDSAAFRRLVLGYIAMSRRALRLPAADLEEAI